MIVASPNDERGYVFPDPIDPGDFYCLKIYVPKHFLYLVAFWHAYEFFTKWVAWARDPLKRGIRVAALWQRAYDLARVEWDKTKGECVMAITGIQQKPLEPCIIQIQVDNGAWQDALDMSCCGGSGGGSACLPALRVAGGRVQEYDPQTHTWMDAGPVTDQNTDSPQTPVSEPTTQSQCDSARNVAVALHKTKGQIATTVADVGAGLVVASDLFLIFVPFQPELALAFGVIEICSLIIAAMEPAIADIGNEDLQDEASCIIVQHINDDGTQTPDQHAAMLAAFGQKAEDAGAGALRAAWNVEMWSAQIVGPSGVNKMALSGNSSGYDCSACPWEVLFDFEQSDCGMVRTELIGGQIWGNYIGGTGWETQIKAAGVHLQGWLSCHKAVEEFQLTGISIEFSSNWGDTIHDPQSAVLKFNGGLVQELDGTYDHRMNHIAIGPTAVQDIYLLADTESNDAALPGAFWIVHKLWIRGTGTKPA